MEIFGIEIFGIIISVIATALITIALNYLFITRFRKIKCLYLPTLSLAQVEQEVKDETTLLYKGKEVDNISTNFIRIKNTRWRAIKNEHMIKPMRLVFDENSSIVSYSKVFSKPEDIDIEISNSGNISEIHFDILNPKDEFTIKYIFVNGTGELSGITGKIEDGKEIKYEEGIGSEEAKNNKKTGILFLLLSSIFIAATFFITLFGEDGQEDIAPLIVMNIFMFIVFLLGVYSLYTSKTKLIETHRFEIKKHKDKTKYSGVNGDAFKFGEYTLYTKKVALRDGRQQIYFFSKRDREDATPAKKPEGYEVIVNEQTGLPVLKKI